MGIYAFGYVPSSLIKHTFQLACPVFAGIFNFVAGEILVRYSKPQHLSIQDEVILETITNSHIDRVKGKL
ncbi:MAG: hypothetical protein D6723_14800 [Acidobacteria bacterium]|nr:MAG: hypothetical protein D6723_14800 [Acidobacteriota bacterium]